MVKELILRLEKEIPLLKIEGENPVLEHMNRDILGIRWTLLRFLLDSCISKNQAKGSPRYDMVNAEFTTHVKGLIETAHFRIDHERKRIDGIDPSEYTCSLCADLTKENEIEE